MGTCPSALTRRAFIAATGTAAAAMVAPRALCAGGMFEAEGKPQVVARRGSHPVVSFFADRPYLDASGRAKPYIARGATGMRVREGLLPEAALSRLRGLI
jgi:hypothetical protein